MVTIDADAHVLENERTWDYMDPSEHKFRPVIVSERDPQPPGTEYWLVDGKFQPKVKNVGQETPKASREMADISSRLRHMDELEIDIQVLYPSLFLRPLTRRPEVELALCKSYNRWLADIWRQEKKRLRWVTVLPLLTIDKALDEARFAKKNGACGIFLRGLEGERRLNDPYFFPVYEEARRLDMPVCVHSATGSFTLFEFFTQECGFSKFKLAGVGAFHSFIYDGIPDKFPGLRFAFIEFSAQWLPYAIHDLAKRFQRRGQSLQKELLREKRIYVACQTDDDMPNVVKYSGENNLVIGSDYGHSDTASEIEALRKLKRQGGLNPDTIGKILDDNPRTLYGL
ncbi:MAG: amidohydrolase family protein [Candidatus Binatia bacterium]